MTVDYPKGKDEVTLARDIFDEIVQDTEREDFNSLDRPNYTKTEIPNTDKPSGSDASLPDSENRNLKTRF